MSTAFRGSQPALDELAMDPRVGEMHRSPTGGQGGEAELVVTAAEQPALLRSEPLLVTT